MSLADSITDLASGTYTVTRTATGTRTLGRYTAGSASTFSIVASVQPESGRVLRALAEGQRADDLRLVITNTELRTRTPTNEPDTISIGGEAFEVYRVEPWVAFGATHYECGVSRVVLP